MSRRIKISRNQLSLPFGEGRASSLSYEGRVRFFWLLVGASLCSLALYFFAINATARNIAFRANLESHLVETEAALSNLEFSYIELKNGISMDLAYQHGFEEVKDPLYVSRNRANTLTLNTVRR